MNKTSDTIQQLDQQSFNAIAGAFSRLQQLGDKKLATGAEDNSQQEKEKLIEYLATEMLAHCGEFLGAWVLANSEYLPLLRSIQAVAKRAGYQPTLAPVQPIRSSTTN